VNFTAAQIKAGRRWAYVTMLAMLALSVAGNLAHTYHINPEPSIRALVYAVMWPLMVWAGVELFVRLPWQAILTHRLVRWVGILLVAAIAALVSYRHLRGLLLADGEEWTVYVFGPLAVDGLMLMSTLGLLLTRSLKGTDEEQDPTVYIREQHQQVLDAMNGEMSRLRRELEARDALTEIRVEPVPASQEVQEHTLKLSEVLPAPVSAPPAIPGLSLGPIQRLPGWTVPQSNVPVKRSGAPRKAWDEARARELLLGGASKAQVAEEVDVHPKTVQRLRTKMIQAGELTA
jgi:hypothetical protein